MRSYRIEAYAIISADGMIADRERQFPEALKNDADKRFFHAALDKAGAIALGRVTHEQERNRGRKRLVLTRKVAALAPDPVDSHALFWNPAGASWDAARLALGLRSGVVAVIGGTDVYQVFLDIGYDAFHLCWSPRVRIPDGTPIFPGIASGRSPDDILRTAGLKAGPVRLLDAVAGVTLVSWSR